MSAGASAAPLHGIRVLDFTHAAAGPFTTMWLADMGADVVKIEKPGRGDGSRFMGESLNGSANSDYYASLNRNKRDILIDLQTSAGTELARKLVAMSDIVVQNFRPGVMDRLGLGFADIARLRTGLVYCSISAFGADGPWRDRPANDIIMQGITGLMTLTGERDGDPVRVGTPMCDYATGLFALSAILAALYARSAHPAGQHVQVNMFDSTIAMMANYIPAVLTLGRTLSRHGRAHAQLVPYQAFRCSDGEYVIVGAFTDAFWRRLCGALGAEHLVGDPRFSSNAQRIANRDVLVSILEGIFLNKTRDGWLTVLQSVDVPCTPVLSLAEALGSEQARTNGTVVELAETEPRLFAAGFPVHTNDWPAPPSRRPPSMGDHTAEILQGLLGMDRAEIDDLADSGVIGLKSNAFATGSASETSTPG
jgi:crotonobetainyl-CoA:carnitine CoA-transferase CaiB-like acyl-CoA transferase